MRILVLVVPRLSVQLARRRGELPATGPGATTQEVGGEAVVAVPSVEASAAGVQAGMSVEEARGRCPALATAAARPGEELGELDRMAGVLRVKATPDVAVVSREAVAVDLAGLGGRYVDERGAAEALAGLARAWLGLEVRAAVADTVEEGMQAARAARGRAVVCEARGGKGVLPRRDGIALRLRGAPGREGLTAGLERLGLVLAAHGASCRELEVTARLGDAVVRRRVRAERPLHRGHELAALLRPLFGELGGAAEAEVRALGLGPAVEVAPRRPEKAGPRRVAGPAVPVQRRLALAS